MEFSEDDSKLLNLWQRLSFGADSSTVSPSDRVDGYRGLLAQITHLKSSGRVGDGAYKRIFGAYFEQYAEIVDEPDEKKGLNTFSAPAVAQTLGQPNVSQKWKSSLTMQSAKRMKCVKALLDKAKERKHEENSEEITSPGLNDSISPTRGLESSTNSKITGSLDNVHNSLKDMQKADSTMSGNMRTIQDAENRKQNFTTHGIAVSGVTSSETAKRINQGSENTSQSLNDRELGAQGIGVVVNAGGARGTRNSVPVPPKKSSDPNLKSLMDNRGQNVNTQRLGAMNTGKDLNTGGAQGLRNTAPALSQKSSNQGHHSSSNNGGYGSNMHLRQGPRDIALVANSRGSGVVSTSGTVPLQKSSNQSYNTGLGNRGCGVDNQRLGEANVPNTRGTGVERASAPVPLQRNTSGSAPGTNLFNMYRNSNNEQGFVNQNGQRPSDSSWRNVSSVHGKRKEPGYPGEIERFVPPNKQPSYGAGTEQFQGSRGPRFQYPGKDQRVHQMNDHRAHQQRADNFSHQATSRGFHEAGNGGQDGDDEPSPFLTAREQYIIDCKKKHQGGGGGDKQVNPSSYGMSKKCLGMRRGPNRKFVPPILNRDGEEDSSHSRRLNGSPQRGHSSSDDPEIDERLKHFDPKIVELIKSEIMDHGPPVSWDDIAGLEFAKNVIKEIVVWPMLRPDIFTGLRGPPKGLLLFGPPGTGKTLIGKCIASQSGATFFSISASSLTSKWVGEGEKMVRVLFAVARCQQPAVVFIDEIDSLLSQRSDGEHESSRRIKTEFLVQLDGAATSSEDRILIIGATNRPHEIDEAARRRLVKRLYIPLPEAQARSQIIRNLLSQQNYRLSPEELDTIVKQAEGYSGSDMSNLCREAALGPIRSIRGADIQNISADQVRPIAFEDFEEAFTQVRASVSQKDLDLFITWNKQYGSTGK